MNEDFKVLMEFLQELAPQVASRELPEPQSESTALLERFARGECSENERAQICRMLQLHPAWLRWLADRVRFANQMAA